MLPPIDRASISSTAAALNPKRSLGDTLMRRLALTVCAACVVAVIATLAVTYHRAGALFNQYDDAYITFRYAMNLATGKGLVFNAGEPTDAASSLLYTLMLAACYRVGLHDLEVVSTVIGMAAVAGTVVVVFKSCLARTGHIGVAAFLSCVTGFSGMVSGWAATGMETATFTFLVSAAVHVLFVLRRLDWGSTILVCLVALTRLEGALLVVAYAVIFASRWKNAVPEARRRLLRLGSAVALAVVGFAVLKLCLYGTAIPHAFLFKSISVLYRPNPASLWAAWESMALGLLVLGAMGLVVQPRRLESWVLGCYIIASVGSVILGPAADQGRYSAHLVPVLAVLASAPLATVAYLVPILALGTCVVVAGQTMQSFNGMVEFNRSYAAHQECRKQVGRFIESKLKPKTPILSSDIGAIAYAAPSASFIDTIALTSADILKRRMANDGVDDILARASDGFVADTCQGPCTTFANFSAYVRLADETAWRSAVPATNFGRNFGPSDPLFICRTPDGLGFAVSRFARR